MTLHRTQKGWPILTPIQEHVALLYDNDEGTASLVYFGMDLVSLFLCLSTPAYIPDLFNAFADFQPVFSRCLSLYSCCIKF